MKPRQFWIKRTSRVEVFESEISIIKPDPHNALWDDFAASTHVIEYYAYRGLINHAMELAKSSTSIEAVDSFKKYMSTVE